MLKYTYEQCLNYIRTICPRDLRGAHSRFTIPTHSIAALEGGHAAVVEYLRAAQPTEDEDEDEVEDEDGDEAEISAERTPVSRFRLTQTPARA
jgi:hypothetical protein